MMILKKIDNNEILKGWEQLWPGREQIFLSDMLFPSGFDAEISKKYTPTHWGMYDNELLIGVNSGHKTSEIHYRGRGVWVHEDYRRQGVSQLLWKAVADQGKKEGCEIFWALPRLDRIGHCLKFGFEVVSELQEFDYGLNAYVSYDLKSHILT